jgi:phosphoglycolate phosphatase-like HAD superfamily hydrolase
LTRAPHDLGPGAASTALAEPFAGRLSRARRPVAVLDVDLTLVENAGRTRALLADFCRARLPARPELVAAALGLDLVFSVHENARRLGIPDALMGDVFPFWRRAFFDPAYLAHDTALAGAVDAVRTLREAGVSVVYLTARPRHLVTATCASFDRLGFPIGVAGTVLVTKEDDTEGDTAFKARALGWIGGLGEVVLVADNEPAHVNAMAAAFPEALALHVATRHSSPAPPLVEGAVVAPSLATGIGLS